jgi:hypothetical protein
MEEGREVSGRVGGRDRERISKLEGKERQLGGGGGGGKLWICSLAV